MNSYKAIIEGKNCWANIDGTARKLGFFTTRVVHALNATQATEVFLRELAEELKSRLLNDGLDPPEIVVNEIVEIDLTEASMIPNAGFTWYREDATLHTSSQSSPD